MTEPRPSREELRRRLREKTSSRNRAGPSRKEAAVPQQGNKNLDIASLMMSMGIDDPELLRELSTSNNPKALLSKISSMVDKEKRDEETRTYEEICAPSHIVPETSDDEEVPDLVVV